MKELTGFTDKYRKKNIVMQYISSNFGEDALECFPEKRIYDNLENFCDRVKNDDFEFFSEEIRRSGENN